MNLITSGFNAEYPEDAPSLDAIHGLSGTLLLEFGTPWCVHCQTAQEAMKDGFAENENLTHIKVLDGKGKRLGRQFGVKLWPTLVLLRDGKEVARIVRFTRVDQVHELLALS